MFLYYALLILLFILICSLISYSIISRRYTYGTYLISNNDNDAGAFIYALSPLPAGVPASAFGPPGNLVMKEHSRTRKLYGGFYVQCSSATKNVKFTVTDGTNDIGTHDHEFNSTNTDIYETVLVKWNAPETTDPHEITIQANVDIQLFKIDYYYY